MYGYGFAFHFPREAFTVTSASKTKTFELTEILKSRYGDFFLKAASNPKCCTKIKVSLAKAKKNGMVIKCE